MAIPRARRRPSRRAPSASVGKPRGVLHPRVQQVGPEHFGIVCFDCAKARSQFLLADFYGRVLIPPTVVAHTRPDLDAAVAQIRQTFDRYQLRDGLVAIERTGRYHRVVQRTFAAAGFETRILHPFVTKQYRQPVDPGNKTDDTDRAAIHRATVTGCALATPWAAQGKDPRHTRVEVGLRFCRSAFPMVVGRQVFRHPSIQGRHYILDKLTAFHRAHDTGMVDVLRDLQAAVGQVPPREHAAEAKPRHEELQRIHEGHRRGPQPLGNILPIVLARLGVGVVQSLESGE